MEAVKEKYRRIRGMILKLLAHQHPHPLDSKVLYVLLDDLKSSISDEEYNSHLVYLEEKGLVKREKRGTSGVRIEMITITPAGLDVLDGFRAEVGVDINF